MKIQLLSKSELSTILVSTFGPTWNKSIGVSDKATTRVERSNASTKQVVKSKGLSRPPANNNHKWIQAIKRVLPAINLLHGYKPTKNMQNFAYLVAHLVTYHGEVETLNRLKLYRLSIQRYILGQPNKRLPFHKYSGPLPKRVRWLKPRFKSTKECRYALSVMRVIELFRVKPSTDVSTITNASTACPDTLHEITQFIRYKCKWLPKIVPVDEGYLPMSNRSGPNGPAAISAIADLTSLRSEENWSLFGAIRSQLRLSIPWLRMDEHDDLEGTWKHSILVFLSDRAGKTRTIGIADWWSNAALSNIHVTFMKALRNLKTDLTFHQNSLNDYIKNLGSDLFSSDMSAFTDRFPIELEVEVVRAVHGEDQAYNWKTIISERSFDTGKSQIRYQVGNPMGILSSWPVSTATHHVIKHYCAWKLAKSNYKYGILGDDSIDTCQEVYNMYQTIIKKLGVEISDSKCTTSNTASCEFAKRLFRNGIEVTGVPVYLLQNLDRMPEQALELVKMCRNRGYSDESLGPSFLNILRTLSKRTRIILTDILSLPEPILKFAPLLKFKPNSYAEKLYGLQEEDQKAYLERARDLVFWEEVERMGEPSQSFKKRVSDFKVQSNHPLIDSLLKRVNAYSGLQPNPDWDDISFDDELSEYTIYEAWMRGDYRYLAQAPSLDTYKYYSRGHKATKCNYRVLKQMLMLVESPSTHPFVHNLRIISDMDLYNLYSERLQQAVVAPIRRTLGETIGNMGFADWDDDDDEW